MFCVRVFLETQQILYLNFLILFVSFLRTLKEQISLQKQTQGNQNKVIAYYLLLIDRNCQIFDTGCVTMYFLPIFLLHMCY